MLKNIIVIFSLLTTVSLQCMKRTLTQSNKLSYLSALSLIVRQNFRYYYNDTTSQNEALYKLQLSILNKHKSPIKVAGSMGRGTLFVSTHDKYHNYSDFPYDEYRRFPDNDESNEYTHHEINDNEND